MTAASQAATVHPRDLDAGEQQHARLRFAAIVRALAKAAGVTRRPAAAAPIADLPDEPTRRVNRLRRLFGRLGKRPLHGGKSRQRTR